MSTNSRTGLSLAFPRSRWGRRTAWTVLALVGARVLLALATPLAFDLAARSVGVDFEYADARLSLVRGEFELRDARLAPRADAEAAPLAQLGLLRVDVDVGALLRGDLRVAQAEVDGLELWLDIAADGSSAWRDLALRNASNEPPASENEPVSLAAPLDFSAQLLRARVHVRDASVSPPLDLTLHADGRCEARDGAGRGVLWVSARDVLRQARVEFDFTAKDSSLEFESLASLDELDLRQLQGRLAAAGLEAVGPALSGSVRTRASVQVLDAQRPVFAGRIILRDVLLRCGDSDALRVDTCELVARELRPVSATFGVLRVVDPSLRLEQLADGRVAFGGVTTGAEPATASDAAPSGEPTSPMALALQRVALVGGRVELHERSANPAQPLELVDARFDASELRWPPDAANAPMRWELRASAPEVFGALALSGSARVQADARTLALESRLELDDATLARLAPQLGQLGLATELQAGRARAELTAKLNWSAGLRLDAALDDVTWSDGSELFGLERVSVDGAELVDRRLRVNAVALSGLRAHARRDANGDVHALGLVLRSPINPASVDEPATNASPSSSAQEPPLDVFQLESLAASASALTFVDESVSPPVQLSLRESSVELEQLDLGDLPAQRRAALRVRLASDELVRQARMDASFVANRESVELTGSLSALDVDLRPLAPFLAVAGVEPTLKDGVTRAAFEFSAQRVKDGWSANTVLREVELFEGERPLAALPSVALEGLAFAPRADGLQFQRLLLEQPYLLVERDAEGRLSSCGVRLGAAARPTAHDTPRAAFEAPAEWIQFALRGERVEMREARLAWRDHALAAPVELELRCSADVNPLELGGAGAPMQGRLQLELAGVCEDAKVDFTARANAQRLVLALQASAQDLRAGPLANYLPAGVEFAHERGSGHAELALEATIEPDGDVTASAELGPTYLLAREGHRTLDIERCVARVRLLNGATPTIELSELSSSGVRAIAELDDEGGLTFAGLRFAESQSGTRSVESASPTADLSAPAAQAPTPRVSVGDLSLELTELKLERPGAEPARLSLRVTRGDEPGVDSALPVWLAPMGEDVDPLRLQLSGALKPLCGEFEVRVDATPFAPSPSLSIEARASELSSAGALALAPELAERLAPGEVEHGEARVALDAHFDLRRRQPLELDPSAPIGFEAELSQLALDASPAGPQLIGLGALRVEGGQYSPRSSSLKIAGIELEKPTLRVARDASGISALGFVLRPSAASSATGAGADDGAAQSSRPQSTDDAEPFDLRIERIVASGLDVLIEDSSGPEPARLPLNALDAELKRFSLRELARGEPLAFRATLGADSVELPPRIAADSLLEGVAAGVADLLDGEDAARARERRPLFAELNLSGKLALAPEPNGWMAMNVEALELPALRGPALASGVEIGDGLADVDVRVRLAGKAGMSVDARTSFSHLSLSEPADGPLTRYLALPAPLDTVLFLLKDAEGRHKFSVGFNAPPEGVSTAALASSAAGAAAEVIARAVASSPLRLLSTLTDVVGITGDEQPPPQDARLLVFESGDPTLSGDARRSLAQLAEKIRGRARKGLVLEHELSRADLERAARLVNPSSGDRARLSARLREQRAELCRERDEAAALARAEFALADRARRAEIAAHLRELEARVGQCDEALERVLDLMRPGAERRAAARARAAAVSLGAERLERVRRELLALGVEPERILTRVVKPQAGEADAGSGRVRAWVR